MADPAIDSGYPKVLVVDNDSNVDGLNIGTRAVRDRYGDLWWPINLRHSDWSPLYYKAYLVQTDGSFTQVKNKFQVPDSGCIPDPKQGNTLIACICIDSEQNIHCAGSYRDSSAVEHVWYARFNTETQSWEQNPQKEDAPPGGDSYDQLTSWNTTLQCVVNADNEVAVIWDGQGYYSSDYNQYSVAGRIHYKSGGSWTRTSQQQPRTGSTYGDREPHIAPVINASSDNQFALAFVQRASSGSNYYVKGYRFYRSGTSITWANDGDENSPYCAGRYGALGFWAPSNYSSNQFMAHWRADNYDLYLLRTGQTQSDALQHSDDAIMRGAQKNGQNKILCFRYNAYAASNKRMAMWRQDDDYNLNATSGLVSISNENYEVAIASVSQYFPIVNGEKHSLCSTGFLFGYTNLGDAYGSGHPSGAKLFVFAVDSVSFPTADAKYVYEGEAPLAMLPESPALKAHQFAAPTTHEIPLSMLPEAAHNQAYTFFVAGNEAPLSMLPEAATVRNNGWHYGEDLPLAILPEANHYRAYTYFYTGEVPLELPPASYTTPAYVVDWIIRNQLIVWRDWIVRNALSSCRDWVIRNKLSEGVARDWIIRNKLTEPAAVDWIIRNILDPGPPGASRDWVIRNVLLGDPEIYQHTVTFTLGGFPIDEDLIQASITMDENAFTNELDLFVASLDPLDTFRAHAKAGQDSLVITIDGVIHKFMVEEIEPRRVIGRAGFQVWGRSKTGKLADPFYSKPITKIWEEAKLASEIIAEVAPGFTIQFDIEDFVVAARELEAESAMPMDIIRRLANVQGAGIRSGRQGELILRKCRPTAPADIAGAMADAVFYESRHVIQIQDDELPAEGWNAVKVEGKSTDADQPGILQELDEDRNFGRTVFEPGEEAFVRAYPKPLDLEYTHQITLGSAFKLGTFEREIEDEEIQVVDGIASTRYPIKDVVTMEFDGRVLSGPEWEPGSTQIKFGVSKGCTGSAYLNLTYKAQYDLWKVTANEEGHAILCLEDEQG